jgi:acetyl esterase/lipase
MKKFLQKKLMELFHIINLIIFLIIYSPVYIKMRMNYFFDKSITKNVIYSNFRKRNNLHIYNTNNKIKKIIIYCHGGAWGYGDKNEFHNLAKNFQNLNYLTVLINYSLYPNV